jgi:phosphatidylserine/phosphatidylglycerophosphate/cardiolipin synthase-like enzyme
MHHKFAIVDENEVITGSFNWTQGSSYNHENILICVDSQVVVDFRQEFNRLWSMMDRIQTSQNAS